MDTDNSMQLSDEINKTNRHRADTKDLNQFVSLAATATELKLIDLIIQVNCLLFNVILIIVLIN